MVKKSSFFLGFFIIALVAVIGYGIWKFIPFTTQPPAKNTNQKKYVRQSLNVNSDRKDPNTLGRNKIEQGNTSPEWNIDPLVVTIFVSIVSHNEDALSGKYADFVADKNKLVRERDAVASFAEMLARVGVKYNYQTDWNFLLGLQKHGSTSSRTDGKNLLTYIQDLGFSVDPHSHEHLGYTYADVAYLLSTFGVAQSGVVGGFLASPPAESILERFWKPISGGKYTYSWTPEILWGGGSSLHQDDESLLISGIWKPSDAEHFTTHSDSAPLPHVGGYADTWDGLNALLELQESGQLEPGMYTQTIFVGEREINDSYIAEFEKHLADYQDQTSDGRILWVTIQEAVDIWKDVYDEKPMIFKYVGSDTEVPKTKVKSACGDGICDELERKTGQCAADCK